MLLEIHYDNPKKLTGVTDSSGVSMVLTEDTVEHEAGVLMVGDGGAFPSFPSGHTLDGIHIPPNQQDYTYSTDCPSACTERMIPHGHPLNVFATSAHAHQSGVAVKMDRFLKLVELRP